MRFTLNDGIAPKKKEEKEGIVFDSTNTVVLTSKEAKERLTYKDSEGNCSFINEGKEVDGVIISMSSKGDLTIGLKE